MTDYIKKRKGKKNATNKLNKEKEKGTKRLNVIIIVGVSLLVVYGLISRNNKLKNSPVLDIKNVKNSYRSEL